jgi:hypothetical protein
MRKGKTGETGGRGDADIDGVESADDGNIAGDFSLSMATDSHGHTQIKRKPKASGRFTHRADREGWKKGK